MRAVTIKEAKAHLNELIDAAARGEQVVLMRGSKHVATITPISEGDLELAPRFSEAQAEAYWSNLAAERRAGDTKTFASIDAALGHLRSPTKKHRR